MVRFNCSQPETDPNKPIPDFAPYKRRHVDAARIGKGRSKYTELRPLLGRIERETGVPEEMMLAIYGHETNYGTVTGNFNAPEALASLAYECRRRALFEAELIAVLKMIDRGVPQYVITGSGPGHWVSRNFCHLYICVWPAMAMAMVLRISGTARLTP